MAREKFVTRTVKKTIAVIACLNRETRQAETITVEFPQKIIDDSKILKSAKKVVDPRLYVVADVVDVNYEDTVLGIPTEVFMENAVEIKR